MGLVFTRPAISLLHHLRYAPLWSALTIYRWRSFDARARALGTVFGAVLRLFPWARSRVNRELLHIFPDMPRNQRMDLTRDMGRKMGQTLFEIYHCEEFQKRHHDFNVSGPGLATLQQAKARGKGAIIVSGHFGQWEAIRAVLKARGMENRRAVSQAKKPPL